MTIQQFCQANCKDQTFLPSMKRILKTICKSFLTTFMETTCKTLRKKEKMLFTSISPFPPKCFPLFRSIYHRIRKVRLAPLLKIAFWRLLLRCMIKRLIAIWRPSRVSFIVTVFDENFGIPGYTNGVSEVYGAIKQ